MEKVIEKIGKSKKRVGDRIKRGILDQNTNSKGYEMKETKRPKIIHWTPPSTMVCKFIDETAKREGAKTRTACLDLLLTRLMNARKVENDKKAGNND